MNIESIIGTWILKGSISINSEISFIEAEPDPNGVQNWLNGKADELIDRIELMTGLTLSINFDGQFRENVIGKPKVYWFSNEGVLENEVKPFNGCVTFLKSNAYLIATEVPSWALPHSNQYGVILRYDDGDTKICDRIDLIDKTIVRTVNVVTDELYLDRVAIVYEKG